jgi:hypothetical protein
MIDSAPADSVFSGDFSTGQTARQQADIFGPKTDLSE